MVYLASLVALIKLLDTQCFLFLNKILLHNNLIQNFFGLLTHKNESWLNVLVMLLLNILAAFMIPKANKSKAIVIILYCWLSFQAVVLINSLIFQKILYIHRLSPSVVIEGSIKLSNILNNANLKDYSNNSFPAGHALVLIYWILFLNLYAPKKIIIISIVIGILLVLSRMITGAHWLSDTLCSVLLGWVYFKISIWCANKYDRIKYCLH